MPAELLKIIVQGVVLERDDEGRIVGEQISEPSVLYTPDQLAEFVEGLEAKIAAANTQEVEG